MKLAAGSYSGVDDSDSFDDRSDAPFNDFNRATAASDTRIDDSNRNFYDSNRFSRCRVRVIRARAPN